MQDASSSIDSVVYEAEIEEALHSFPFLNDNSWWKEVLQAVGN